MIGLLLVALACAGAITVAGDIRPGRAAGALLVLTAGEGSAGEIGNGANADTKAFVDISSDAVFVGKTISGVQAGANHACVFTAESTRNVYCWGANTYGQLGDNTTTARNVPTIVSTTGSYFYNTRAVTMSLGGDNTCVIGGPRSSGPLAGRSFPACWGTNSSYNVGSSGVGPYKTASEFDTLHAGSVVSISTGMSHSCAAWSDGTVRCWGRGDNGELGDGSTSSQSVPVTAAGALSGKNATEIAVGEGFSCSITDEASNNAYCWGYVNTQAAYVALGDGTSNSSAVPVRVSLGGAKLVSISAGTGAACGITSTNTLVCWGSNASQLFGSTLGAMVLTPAVVNVTPAMGTRTLDWVEIGFGRMCIASTTGRLACSGYTNGDFGFDPAAVPGLQTVGGLKVIDGPTLMTAGALATGAVKAMDFTYNGTAVYLVQQTSSPDVTPEPAPAGNPSAGDNAAGIGNSPVGATTTTVATSNGATSTARLVATLKGAGTKRKVRVATYGAVKKYQVSTGKKSTKAKVRVFTKGAKARTFSVPGSKSVWLRVLVSGKWSAWVKATT